MSLTVLRLGVDTLEASIGGVLKTDAASELAALKARAQEFETPQYIQIDGLDFAVQAQGLAPYKYNIVSDDATIRLSEAKSIPAAFIRLSALGLALYEPADLYRMIAGMVDREYGCDNPHKLSRIDVACDFQGFDPAGPHGAEFVCPASFRPIYPNTEHPETFQFGKKEIVVRVYNKTAEIKKSGKTWLPALWGQHPDFDPDADVWRFEVQLRRKRLRELELPSPESAIENMEALLKNGLAWADLRIPDGTNKSRWHRHPAWEELDAATCCHTTLTRQALESGLSPMFRIVPAVAGYAVSAGAVLDMGDFDEVWGLLGDKVLSYIISKDDGKGSYTEDVCRRQIERLGKGDRR